MPANLSSQTDPLIANADTAAEAYARAARSGASLSPDLNAVTPDMDSALDKALEQAQAEEAKRTPQDVEVGRENGGVRTPIEGEPTQAELDAAAAAEAEKTKEAADKAAADKLAEEAKKAVASKKGPLDDLVDPTAPKLPEQNPAATDPYDGHKLRSDASPKTQETFDNLKKIAREREAAAEARALAAEAKVTELAKEAETLKANPLTPELQQELKDLRAFRVQFDVENTPEFRSKYDKKIDEHFDSVYSRLSELKLSTENLDYLKKLPLVERTRQIDAWLELLQPAQRREIERKMLAISSAQEERHKALQEAREGADKALAEQREAPTKRQAQQTKEIADILRPVLPQLPWIHTQEIPAGASAEQRKQLESANIAAAQYQEELRTGILDSSPTSRAKGALAVPVARYYQSVSKDLQARLAAAEKELSEIRRSSATGRTARSSASNTPVAAPVRLEDTDTALDALLAQAQAERH